MAEKPENIISNEHEQTIDAKQENGSGGIMTKIRNSTGRRLKVLMFLVLSTFGTVQFECQKTTKSGEKIEHIFSVGNRELGDKTYKKALLERDEFALIDPGTLEILKTKSGQWIEDISPFVGEKLGGKEYIEVKLRGGKYVYIDPETLEILKVFGKIVTRVFSDDEELGGNKKYKGVRFEDNSYVFIDPETLEIKE